jgi:hypothetical protein
MKKMYVIIVCYECGIFLLAKTQQKTKKCNYCSTKLNIIKTKKIAYIKTAQEASRYLRTIKNKEKQI